MKVFLKGLNSCAMRRQNLLRYREYLERNGHTIVDTPEESDVLLVWTCAFREDVKDNSLDEIDRFRRQYGEKVIAAGCLPDIEPEELHRRFPGPVISWRDEDRRFEAVFGPARVKLSEVRPVWGDAPICADAAAYRARHPEADVTFHDQFIKLLVAEGCPFDCAYCTERLAFPPFRSIPPDALAGKCRQLVEETGETRVILLADCLGEYGKDIGSSLPALLRALRKVNPELTFALNNLHPVNFLEYAQELLGLIRAGWVCHLNLPIQSASDRVLDLMRRRYTRADLESIAAALRGAGFRQFDTHLIVGFPGEREEDHRQTMEFILAWRPRYVLISRYFETRGAPASALPDKVDADTAGQRVAEAGRAFREAGILCNAEGGEVAQERLRRLNI